MLETSQATAQAYQSLFPWLPYTRTTYTSKLRVFQPTGGRHHNTAISILKNSGLMFEMERWLEGLERVQWCVVVPSKTQHGRLDGRVRRIIWWLGGLIRGLHYDVFRAGGDFPPTLAEEHIINVHEGYALQQTLRLFCADHPDDIAGSTLVSDVDNKVLHDAFIRGRAKNTIMHDTIIDLFRLQVRHDFALKLR